MAKELIFPEGFLWGAATSSYQVEGGIDNSDWSEDFPAGMACDYWNRYAEYADLARELNQNVHRLSLEWSRIEPEEGKFDREAIGHYREMLLAWRARGIKTMVTIWHFSTPGWLAAEGGWRNLKAPELFQRYAGCVAKELDPCVDFWVTINEPMIYASQGYLIGRFPPRRKLDLVGCGLAAYNLARAHRKGYAAIKHINPQAQVGLAENFSYVEPLYKDPLSRLIVSVWDGVRNRLFLELTSSRMDFIGVNYYFHERIKWDVRFPFVSIENSDKVVSDLGTEVYPQGIYRVLKELSEYGLPLFVTENGLADREDRWREKFIRDHLRWVHKAIGEGADVRGYLHWSLLDNFEWADGFGPRFGLVEMDYEHMNYRVRPSARNYAEICKHNKIIIEK